MDTQKTIKERPISFFGEMVRAILDGRKTQTRRLVNPQPNDDTCWVGVGGCTSYMPCNIYGEHISLRYGRVGDRLWVRESARLIETTDGLMAINVTDDALSRRVRLRYEADGIEFGWLSYPARLAPLEIGLCVPNGCYREAARIILEIIDVRVERLNDISEHDARCEGDPKQGLISSENTHIDWFKSLWESINGPGSWAANPWVWVIEFKRVQP